MVHQLGKLPSEEITGGEDEVGEEEDLQVEDEGSYYLRVHIIYFKSMDIYYNEVGEEEDLQGRGEGAEVHSFIFSMDINMDGYIYMDIYIYSCIFVVLFKDRANKPSPYEQQPAFFFVLFFYL